MDAILDWMPDLVTAPPWDVIEAKLEGRAKEPNAEVVLRDGMGRPAVTGVTTV